MFVVCTLRPALYYLLECKGPLFLVCSSLGTVKLWAGVQDIANKTKCSSSHDSCLPIRHQTLTLADFYPIWEEGNTHLILGPLVPPSWEGGYQQIS